jgi:hypothetical protein
MHTTRFWPRSSFPDYFLRSEIKYPCRCLLGASVTDARLMWVGQRCNLRATKLIFEKFRTSIYFQTCLNALVEWDVQWHVLRMVISNSQWEFARGSQWDISHHPECVDSRAGAMTTTSMRLYLPLLTKVSNCYSSDDHKLCYSIQNVG